VYIAFEFTGNPRIGPGPEEADTDTLREVKIYRLLEGCL
jgi:hypothetical protein